MKNHASVLWIASLLFAIVPTLQAQDASEMRLYVSDGQLTSHPLRVFVTTKLTQEMRPRLNLNGATARTPHSPGSDVGFTPLSLSTHNTIVEDIDGQKVFRSGTLLLFDVSDLQLPFYQAIKRISPSLTWSDPTGGEEDMAILTDAPMYVGNLKAAIMWTLLLIAGVIVLLTWACHSANRGLVEIIYGTRNFLSLSRLQVAAWTIVIGGMVCVFGLMQLKVPSIPDSLVVLMGMSLATGTISYAITKKKDDNSNSSVERSRRDNSKSSRKLINLIADFEPDGTVAGLSIARTQMLFWTILLLALFVVKSTLDGELWEIPWQMVILMGFSQGAYLGPNALPSKEK